jgi:hypothetical protein
MNAADVETDQRSRRKADDRRALPRAVSNLFRYIWCHAARQTNMGHLWRLQNDATVDKTGGDVRITWPLGRRHWIGSNHVRKVSVGLVLISGVARADAARPGRDRTRRNDPTPYLLIRTCQRSVLWPAGQGRTGPVRHVVVTTDWVKTQSTDRWPPVGFQPWAIKPRGCQCSIKLSTLAC